MNSRKLVLLLSLLIACREEDPKDTQTLPVDTGETAEEEVDADGDGHTASDDCNDSDPAIHPDARERCDDLDNDCDGLIDDEDPDIYGADTWYADSDQDGWGADLLVLESCEQPTGYVDNQSDCNDLNASVNPDADELCDGTDNDCDGTTDEDDAIDASGWFEDADGDGYGSGSQSSPSCSPPAGYVLFDGDCDDTDPTYHPGATEADCSDANDYNCDGSTGFADADTDGFAACEDCDDTDANANDDAPEICDGIDNDCDGDIDGDDGSLQGATTYYGDSDGDGYGGGQYQQDACTAPPGYVSSSDDCDDLNAASHPGASEICDGLDNDCDTDIDEGVGNTWYADSDSDGYGNGSVSTDSCDTPSGYVGNALDCDDFDAATNPSAYEICDGSDNDCDGDVDEQGAFNATTWYADGDGDGYGSSISSQLACDAPSGHVDNSADCNDADATISPEAGEVCDTVDNDCDGSTDESDATDATTWYADADGDTYGNPANSTTACSLPASHVSDDTDCNDTTANAHPGANELCDSIDNNCDGAVDETTAINAGEWYEDADGDGFGDINSTTRSCTQPSGYVDDSTDCDDTPGSGAASGSNANDADCDGTVTADDCDDADASSTTTATDADCDGVPTTSDCDDSNASTSSCASCNAILAAGLSTGDGMYNIDPSGSSAFQAYCDMTTDSGGWTMVMRASQHDSGIDFNTNSSGWSSTGYSDITAISLTNTSASQDFVSPAYDQLTATNMLVRNRLGSDLLYAVHTTDGFMAGQSARHYLSQSVIDGGRACSSNITYLGGSPQHGGYNNLVLSGDESGDTEPTQIGIRSACAGDNESLAMGSQGSGHGTAEVTSQSGHWGSLTSMFVFVR